MKGWILLIIAVMLEVIGTSALDKSDGFRRLLPGIIAVALYIISLIIFSRALLYIPLGLAYALWAGFGIIIVNCIALFLFKQELRLWSYFGMSLILIGAIIASLAGGRS